MFMPEDLFAQLDNELNNMTLDIKYDMEKQNAKKAEITKSLIENFWKVWIRFDKIKVPFTMEPSYSTFATFEEFPEHWEFRNIDFAQINTISLVDRSQEQGRTGDSLKAWYYTVDKSMHLRIVFEYCEGEHYYKYSGWKRIFTQQIIYDAPLERVNFTKIWDVLAGVIKVWFESHLRHNRDIIIKYCKENFEKGETFTQ